MKNFLSSIFILLAFCIACPDIVYADNPAPQTVQLRKKNKQNPTRKASEFRRASSFV